MKILFCTDGSDISLETFKNATAIMKHATVDIICVIDWSFLPDNMSIERTDYEKAYENIAESVLNYAENLIKSKQFEVGDKIKSVGSPIEGILEQLENTNYDMVIIGSHGKKGLQKWLGSVSRGVVSSTKVPVFVSKKPTEGKKILFAVNGSEQSINSIKRAVKLFKLESKEIYILYVHEKPELLFLEANLDPSWLENIAKHQKIYAVKVTNYAKNILEENGIKTTEQIILTGNPAEEIIEFAKREKTDLIVMGGQSRSELSEFLISSISMRVLSNSYSDILIVKD